MKTILGIGLFLILGIISAFGFGFYSYVSEGSGVHDYEQQGLNQEIVIKFSFVVAENTPKGLAARRFAELVKTYTNNKVKVELFPNSILYDDADEINALRNGTIQMIAPSFSKISGVASRWAVMDLPFAFTNEEAIQEAFDGEIGKSLMEDLGDKGIIGLAFWKNGFKQISSSRGPIIHPSDFQGLHFRVMPSKILDEQFRQLRAKPIATNFNETYQSLENGSVNSQENTISNIYSKKFYEVQKYITLSNHGYLGYGVLMNKAYWESIPSPLQKNIMKAMEEATHWGNHNAEQQNLKELEEIKAQPGLQISELTDAQRQEWKSALLPVYQKAPSIVGRELVTAVQKLQQNYETSAIK